MLLVSFHTMHNYVTLRCLPQSRDVTWLESCFPKVFSAIVTDETVAEVNTFYNSLVNFFTTLCIVHLNTLILKLRPKKSTLKNLWGFLLRKLLTAVPPPKDKFNIH